MTFDELIGHLTAARDECDEAARNVQYPESLRILWQGRALGVELAIHALQLVSLAETRKAKR